MKDTSLAGYWQLTSAKLEFTDGAAVEPYGARPKGLLVLSSSGILSAQIMGNDRSPFATPHPMQGTPEETKAVMDRSVSYFGEYTLDPANGKLVTKVIASLFPNWEGGEQVRDFRLEDDGTLVLSTPVQIEGRDGALVFRWRRSA
jgi:hypothetical protein